MSAVKQAVMAAPQGADGDSKFGREPNKLLHVVPVHYFAVEYSDGEGAVKSAVVMGVGGTFYMPQEGERYAKAPRPVSKWLQDQLVAAPGVVPLKNDEISAALKKEQTIKVL
jgi:hypothetical protein